MTEKKASQKALEKIMNGEVKQKPQCLFLVRNIILWSLGVLSVFAGAIAVSLIIFTVVNSDMDLYREMYGFAMSRFTILLIILWVVITSLLLVLSDFSLRSTKCGYRYPLWFILSVDILISMVFGGIFYLFGVGNYVDESLSQHLNYYHNVEKRSAQFFHKPEKGVLMGVVARTSPSYVEVMSADGKKWAVHVQNIKSEKRQDFYEGARVVFAGQTSTDNIFIACDVRMRNLHGVHHRVHQKHLEMIEKMQEENHSTMINQMNQILIERACEGGPQWQMKQQLQ